MRVSCLIPAYNEATTVAGVVRAARACPEIDEVLVISDGSTDDTALRAAEGDADRVLVLPSNQGKGAAIRAGAAQARGEILLLIDADLCGLRPEHLTQLLAPVLAGGADMSVGLFTGDRRHGLLVKLSGQRALRRALLQHVEGLAGTGFGFELALDQVARREGVSIVRVPLSGVTHRRKREKYGMVVGTRQGVRASADIFRQVRRRPPESARRLTAPSRTPRSKRRPQPMALAVLLTVVLLLILGPVFLTRPSHAARVIALSPLQPEDRVLLVVAHPDDEIIGAGGVIATARRAGIPVSVVVLTNGDSNRVSAALIGRHLPLRPEDFIRTGAVRQQETLAGLRLLGVPANRILFFGFPDRVLDRVRTAVEPVSSPFTHLSRAAYAGAFAPEAPYTGEALRGLLGQVVADVRPTVIITHAPFDYHSDHQAAFALVQPLQGTARLYTFLVHAPGFPRPLRSAPRDALRPPDALAHPPGWTWVEFPLSPQARADKLQALRLYRSQMETPYLRLLLPAFLRTNELFALPATLSEGPEMTR